MKLRIFGATRKFFDKDSYEISIATFMSITGGLIAGLILTSMISRFELIPALIVLIPGFLAMQGSVNGSMAARLTVDLYLKKIPKKFKFTNHLIQHIISSFFLVIFISVFLGLIASFLTFLFFDIFNIKIILISVISGFLAILIQLPLSIAGVFWSFNKGFDPDDVMGPYVTVVGDIVGILALFLVILIST